ncbi:tryptase-2-like [Anabas testudineus]|uniref:Peptidase S1 domain-containing protein n=1 Tax=Anabas testudineus TaxID=64144 RepID=A0AAQ6IMH7_ANATE|nr:tryptase-2-like [Anabas testudineus]
MAFCKLFSVLVLIHNTGDLFGAEVRSGIIGGQDAPKGRWPWMVHINVTSDGVNRWRCGGTILNKQWVLTAAHCFDDTLNPNLRRSMVWAGTRELQTGFPQFKGIYAVLKHSEYRNLGNRYINDVALVKLKTPLKLSDDVKAVKLPSNSDNFSPSSECWITGWGNTDNDVPLKAPETLQQRKINIVDCNPGLPSDVLCAGGNKGDACEGDYGGPLVCFKAGAYIQVGIMSYGSPEDCGAPGRLGVYSQVSKYKRFIDDYIHHGSEASDDV